MMESPGRRRRRGGSQSDDANEKMLKKKKNNQKGGRDWGTVRMLQSSQNGEKESFQSFSRNGT